MSEPCSFVNVSVKRLEEMIETKALHNKSLIELALNKVEETATLRAEHQKELAIAEAKRIDAIRAVDVSAVAVASERAAQQAIVLANQVSASAETLRSLVATTANTVANQLADISKSFNDRLAVLEKSSYLGTGRSAISDPMVSELVAEMRKLREDRDIGSGKSSGSIAMWGYVAGAIGLLGMVAGLALTIYHVSK